MWTHEREEVAESLGQLTVDAWRQRLEDVTRTLRGGAKTPPHPVRWLCFALRSAQGSRSARRPSPRRRLWLGCKRKQPGPILRCECREVCPSLAVAYAALSFLSLERTGERGAPQRTYQLASRAV